MKSILQGASPDELRTMHKLIISDAQCCEWRVALIALMDGIRNAYGKEMIRDSTATHHEFDIPDKIRSLTVGDINLT
ncbi:hypothetical protein JHK85_024988 [Glycine max]|nr:hypothetical protein JHK85_024988 [Glycine max]